MKNKELKIALVQTSLIWEAPEENREKFSQLINGVEANTDLIVLPEMFTTGFTMTPENLGHEQGKSSLLWMQKTAEANNIALTGSFPYFENSKYTNRLYLVTPEKNTYWYDKRHTFTLAGEDQVYASGNRRLVVDYRGFRICPMICYDLRFPVWSRYQGDYDVLLYVANWPTPRIDAWDTLLKARAIENMSYCIGVNRVGKDQTGHDYPGHSAVYDCLGEQITYSEVESIIYQTLSLEHIKTNREKLKFLDDRDTFSIH